MDHEVPVDEITDDDLLVIVTQAHANALSRAEKARLEFKDRMDQDMAIAEGNAALIFGISP